MPRKPFSRASPDLCGCPFALGQPLLTIPGPSGVRGRTFACPMEDCDRVFERNRQLRIHLISHATHRPFKVSTALCRGAVKSTLVNQCVRNHFALVHRQSLLHGCPQQVQSKVSLGECSVGWGPSGATASRADTGTSFLRVHLAFLHWPSKAC